MQIHGHCDDRFAAVQQAFEQNFANGEEVGASATVTIDGEFVVDIWAGDADESGRAWERDTIVNVYSTTKTMAGLCMLMLADRGQLDFDAPVAQYWPEFGANGKEGVLVKHVMSHTSAVPGFSTPIEPTDLYDWDKICGLLAAESPWWEPGTVSGYHAVTQGYLQGEIFARIAGETMDEFFRREVAGPLGADFHMCLDAEHDSRVGDLIPPEGLSLVNDDVDTESVAFRTLSNPVMTALEPRTREWRQALIPAAGGLGNARSVGRVHSAMACGGTVDGVTLLSEEGVAVALQEQYRGEDLVFSVSGAVESRYGMGYGLGNEVTPFPDGVFYWGGWGGSLAIIDTVNNMTISYVMNKMALDLMGDLRGGGVALAAMATVMS